MTIEKKLRKHYTLAYASILVLGLAVGLLYLWIFDNRNPVTVNEYKVTHVTHNSFQIRWDLSKKRECAGFFTRQIIDRNNVVWDLFSDNEHTFLEVGRHEFVKGYLLPHEIPSGKATFRTSVLWSCNPLKNFTQQIATVDFIVPKPSIGDM